MSLAKSIFGIDLQSVNYEFLTNFFSNQQEEGSKLEFKSGEIEIESLFKEVCAFLNTDGGVLVLGAPKEKTIQLNKHTKKRICQGELTPTKFRNSSWLHQKLSSNISPAPFGIVIQEIITETDNYFILEIPKSINPPHQSLSDGTYYIRIDEQARPAPHGIVESLFFRRQNPKLTISCRVERYVGMEDELVLRIDISNATTIPTDRISFIANIMNVLEVSNIDNATNKYNVKENSESSFSVQAFLEQTIVNRISIPIELLFKPKNEPFYINVLAWGKEVELFEISAIWEPDTLELLKKFKTDDNPDGLSNDDIIKELEKLTSKSP